MEEHEFQRLLDLFPVVRSRDYWASSESSGGSKSRSAIDEPTEWKDAWNKMDEKVDSNESENDGLFWQKLRLAAERKVGAKQSDKFCQEFRMEHEKLVNREFSLDAVGVLPVT